MDPVIRLEQPGDYRRVEEITREAFWNLFAPGCSEHYLVHRLRTCPQFIPELDFVAVADGAVVGNILYSRAEVRQAGRVSGQVISFGPLSVLPEWQGRGIGAALIRHSLAEAARMGFGAVIIYGHPGYYRRFGFQPARMFNITTPDGKFIDPLMALELREGALAGVSGSFFEAEVFHMDPAEVEAFDAGFPPKEKTDPKIKID